MTNPWPTQNARGALLQYTYNGALITGVQRPTASSSNIVIGYDGNNHVSSVTNNGVAWTYSFTDSGSTRTAVATGPLGAQETVVSDIPSSEILSSTDGLGHTTRYTYDGFGRVTDVGLPSNIHKQYVYDGRGNVTSTTKVSNNGSGSITSSASYADTVCAHPTSCNKPSQTVDSRGGATDYTYDPTTGAVLTITAPAGADGVRPQTRYAYTTVNGVALLASVSQCMTKQSCAGTSDEARTTIAYGQNDLPTSVTKSAGDGSIVATTTYAYDALGNVTSINGPLPGAVDVSILRYDAYREIVGVVGPDPDGSGPRTPAAEKYSYNDSGQLWFTSVGTVTDQSDNAWANFTESYHNFSLIDGNNRTIRTTYGSNGLDNGLSDYLYDALGRSSCTIVYMDSSRWGPQATACTPLQTNGASGPDRVTQRVYDAASKLTSVVTGLGTASQRTEALTYTPDGKTATVTDANGNLTAFTYDGFDRLVQTTYPSPGAIGQANANDFESYGYDAAGNRTSLRKRDGRPLTFQYDSLNRLINKSMTGGCAPIQVGTCPPASATRGVVYAYDLRGLLTYARFDGPNGEGVTSTYDALGRLTSSTTAMSGTSRTLGYQYDAAGNRTQILHPDGVHFDMSYDATSQMGNASWYAPATGTVPFVAIQYDNLGRRTDINRASSNTGYFWDAPGQRLGSTNQRFANAGFTESYSYNPANQITLRNRDSDEYAYTGAVAVNRPYAANGLNQYTTAGPATFTYDANGNLISDGTNGYLYDAENRMIASSANGVALTYDPLGRLFSTASGALGTTQFLTDADHVAVEYDGSNGSVRRRFMWGPGADEPIVEDTGGQMNCSGTRFLHTNYIGSVVALADCWGNRYAINGYDEFGVPNANNFGRYQYTGQAWLADVGMYYYKARMYSPTLGRFMQTDPIGYSDGLNWHNYAHGDPINGSDPSGLAEGDLDNAVKNDGGGTADSSADEITVTGTRDNAPQVGPDNTGLFDGQNSSSANSSESADKSSKNDSIEEIVVTAKKIVPVVVVAAPIILIIVAPEIEVPALVIEEAEEVGALARIGRFLNRVFGQSCFAAGTLVETSRGLRAIETIKPGDMVLSRDEATGRTEYRRVTAVKVPTEDELYTVEVDVPPSQQAAAHRADFQATATHPWRTTDERWVPTSELQPGMQLVRADGAPAQLDWVRDTNRKAPTYNLTVEGYHTYFVGTDHVWVHNACPPEMRDATRNELMSLAKRNNYKTVEEFKTQELQLNSRDQIAVDKNGNLFSYPRQGNGPAQPLGISIDD